LNKKELEIAEKKAKAKYLESFAKDLENRPLIIEEFDEDIWCPIECFYGDNFITEFFCVSSLALTLKECYLQPFRRFWGQNKDGRSAIIPHNFEELIHIEIINFL
jgi:hypothetical protein